MLHVLFRCTRRALAAAPMVCTLLAFGTGCGAVKDTVLEEARESPSRQREPVGQGPTPAALVAKGQEEQQPEAPQGEVAKEAEGAWQEQSNVAGRIANKPFSLPHAIVLRGHANVGGSPETVVFVASDQPGLCGHLQAGTLPKNSRMLAVALLDGRDYRAGLRFMPGGDPDAEEGPLARPFLRTLDDACRIDPVLGQRGAEGVYGEAQLLALTARGGHLSFEFEFENDAGKSLGKMAGEVVAPLCDAPMLFEKAVNFFEHKVPAGTCL